MKGIGNKAVKFSLALVLVLSIGLILAMPTAQASVNNTVNMDFFKAYIHSTESNFVGYDESLPAGIMTGTGLHNQAEDPATGESVVGPSQNGGPLLTFTPGDVGITELEMQDLRPESEYIWDLYPILENEGRGRSVGADLEGVSFQPGYTVDRTLAPTEFSGPGTYTQTLDIYTTPAESMMELVIVVQIPDNPQLTATITGQRMAQR